MKEPAYTDEDLMNFGKYINLRMMDVPAAYFHWIYTEGVRLHDTKLHNYIENSLVCLKDEYPDGIWRKP